MIILGLDPAIRTTGYGVIEAKEGSPLHLLDCGVIANTPRMSHSDCVRRIFCGVTELIKTFNCEVAAIEAPFVGKNYRTAIILGMARGAIVSALSVAGIDVYSYQPSVAKLAAAGRGNAGKAQVALLLAHEFGIDPSNISLDSTDAISLALCHYQRLKYPVAGKMGQKI
jgi:crossover junction endodeoxyribonuclease RuvC